MVNQNKTLDQIYDIFAVRIKVETVIDCYAALGVIHEMYTPIPGRFKDYIAMPKQNMYQSLHTTVIGPDGQPFEVQIRTYEMHRIAEYGIAAHWKYKENAQGDDNEEEKLSWLRQILEWQTDMSNNHEFLNLLKTDLDLFQDTVYCFTPSGDVKALPTGSNTIDFAYSIHSAVGNKMVGARINGRQVPIETKLQNGDRVEIVTSQNSKGPSRDWLLLVKSTQAKNKINNWFKTQFKEENIVKGKELMERYCKAKGYAALGTYLKPEYVEKVLRKYSFKDWDSLCASVGHGGLKEGQVVNKLIELYKKDRLLSRTDHEVMDSINEMTWREKGSHAKNGIVVEGADDVSVRFSKCCSPVPGDEIIGFITRGRGISIHRTDCVNIINISESDKPRLIEASWQVEEGDQSGHYSTELVVYANNRVGLMVDITRIFSEENVDIISVSSRTSKQGIATINVSFYISGTEMLNRMIQKIRGVESVIDIERSAG